MRETTFRAVAAAAVALGLLALPARLPAQEAASVSPRIAVIDVGRILEESTAGKALLNEIQTLAQQKGDEGKPLADKVQRLQKQIEEGRMSLAQDKLAELNKQLQDSAKSLKRFEDDANEEIGELRERRLKEIEARVMRVVNEVGTEFGYTMMFNKFQSGLVFAQEEIDITDLILERFDAATDADAASGE